MADTDRTRVGQEIEVALREVAVHRRGEITLETHVVEPDHLFLEPERKHSDFHIGMEFMMSDARWRCTDVGARRRHRRRLRCSA